MPQGYKADGAVDVPWWIEQVTKGKSFRKIAAFEDRWPAWRRWGRGEWDKGILPSNVYFKMVRTLVPRTYFRNPSVSITQTKPGLEYMLLAKLLERVDNKLIDIMGVKEQMKRAVLNATMFGTGFIRRGYGAEFTPTPADISTEGPDVGGRKRQLRVEYNDLIKADQPWALSAHPGDMILPEYCTDMHSARWVCYETTRSTQDLMDDPRFEDKGGLQEGLAPKSAGSMVHQPGGRKAKGTVVWEIRDKKAGLVFVLAPYQNNSQQPDAKPLYEEEDRLQRNGRLPAYPLIFNSDDEVVWGIPDSIIIEPQQVEANEVRTQLKYHRRALLKKMLIQKGMMTPDEMSKLLSDDNVDIGILVGDINGVKPLEAGNLPPGLIEMGQLISQEVQEQLGLGVNQFGEYAPGSADRSATEANIVNQATAIRIDERRDTSADLITLLVSDMNDDIAEYWSEEMIVDIAGPAGRPIWLKAQPELLRDGHWDVKVDPDSSIPLTKQYREQKAMQMYAAFFGKNQFVDPQELTHFVLNEAYGVDADAILANPAMNTSPQNPMTPQQAAQHLQQMPQGAGQQPQSPRPAGPPAQPVQLPVRR